MKPRALVILDRIRAREAGSDASRKGEQIDANPFDEADDLHWQWLDGWVVSEQSKTRERFADKKDIPFLR